MWRFVFITLQDWTRKANAREAPQSRGGFTDGERVVEITRARPTEDIDTLNEQADIRMILHAAYAVRDSPTSAIVIQSPYTDVLVLCVSRFTGIGCNELWFRTGVSDCQRYIYRLTHSASELSGFTCTSSLTMNEKFQHRTRPPSAVLKNFEFNVTVSQRKSLMMTWKTKKTEMA